MTWWHKFNRRESFPSVLSYLRGILGICLTLMFLSESLIWHIIAILVFIFAAITDYLDGWFARRYGQESDFGRILDPTMDKILILAPFAIFAFKGFYSPGWVVLVFIREIIVTFCRIGWYREGKAVGAEKLGKLKLCIQVAAIGVAAVYLIALDLSLAEPVLDQVGIMMQIFVIAAVVLTVVSGFSFLYNNQANFQGEAFAKFVCAVGVGFMPVAPGTWGSAAGLLLISLLVWNVWLYWAIFLFLFGIGYVFSKNLDLSRDHDPGYVVIDEVCGMFVTLAGVALTPSAGILGFFIFRFFDIIKPFPARQLEKLPGYWGIMSDDLAAGVYSCLTLHLLLSFL